MSSSATPVDYVRAGAMAAIWQRRVGKPSRVQAPDPRPEPDHLPARAKVHNPHGPEDNVTDHKLTDPNMKITKPAARASKYRKSRPSAEYIQSLNDRVTLLEAKPTSPLGPETPESKSRSSHTYPDPEEFLAKLKAFQPGSQHNTYKYIHPHARNNLDAAPSTPTLPAAPQVTSTPRKTLHQTRLKEVVDAAIERSNELGNPVLALALKNLYEESVHNSSRARLLETVLAGNQTAEETTAFGGFVSKAKRELKRVRALERVEAQELAQKAVEDASEIPMFVREVQNGGMDLGAGESASSKTKALGNSNGNGGEDWTLVEEKEAVEPWMSVGKFAKVAKE